MRAIIANRKAKRRPTKMTIIVGVEFESGIVVASDSQGTADLGVEVKRLDCKKIYSFESTAQNVQNRLIVAGSGTDGFITRAAEIVEQVFSGGKFASCRDIADVIEDAATTLYKRYVIDRLYKLGLDLKSLPYLNGGDDDGLDLGLLAAVHCGLSKDKKPTLYTITGDGQAQKEEHYGTMGCGAVFAEYLLQRMWQEKMTEEMALNTAIYVVEETKRVEPNCGGPIQVAVLSADKIRKVEPVEVDTHLGHLGKTDSFVKIIWRFLSGDPEAAKEFRKIMEPSSN
jgi:20S proteasome alpha/beta subunit